MTNELHSAAAVQVSNGINFYLNSCSREEVTWHEQIVNFESLFNPGDKGHGRDGLAGFFVCMALKVLHRWFMVEKISSVTRHLKKSKGCVDHAKLLARFESCEMPSSKT
jgi:hypothetical protein